MIFFASVAVWLAGAVDSTAADLLLVEAESGALGTNFLVGNSSGTIYISNTNNYSSTTVPGIPGRVASYSVTFPNAGTYDLYARVRVGPGAANDDSFFYANGFGTKSPTASTDWILCNNLWNVGFTNAGDIVTGGGIVQTGAWKWIDISQFNGGAAPINFTVTAGNLTQTFQIGGREDGFDMDKFAFGTTGTSFAVSNLDSGTVPYTPPITNVFVGPDGVALHRFSPLNNGINADGANPAAGLMLSGGVLCGTTLNGGLQGYGTAFYVSPDGTNFNAFRSFTNAPDSGNPEGDLAVAGSGFFGTSLGGGNSGVGSVYLGSTDGSGSLIQSFAVVSANEATNSGGASPSGLLALSGNTLYGTTAAGGAAANGTVFSLSTNGSAFADLHDFGALDSNTGTNSDGALPMGGLLLSGSTLYGTASAGGSGGAGVVFSLDTSGGSFTVLHNFTPLDPVMATNPDGAFPAGGLVLSNGILYGTTFSGGTGGKGVIFSMGADGSGFAVLHNFSPTDPLTGTNWDGASPCAPVALSGGKLYGTASAGGTNASGTVFSMGTSGAQFQTLHAFTAIDPTTGTNRDGALPVAGVLPLAGSLYGTTFSGGPGGEGTVFALALPPPPANLRIVQNPDGSVTVFFVGGPNSTNVIQATTLLGPTASWHNISTNKADGGGLWQYTNSTVNLSPPQFYRSYSF